MAEATAAQPPAQDRPRPVVDWLKFDAAGPYLEGHRCEQCSAVYLSTHAQCGKCTARDALRPVRLATRGTLYAYSIVHRSHPGIAVPYVSAIVDLEGGGTIKGNLVDIAPDPDKIRMGMPVEVVFRDALGRRDRDGHSYVSYFFKPASH